MTETPTFWLDWQRDFLLTPSGSIQTAVGWTAFRQRVVRRIITNPAQQLPDGTFTPADYVFVPSFGEGLGSLVDQDFSADNLSDTERRISLGVLADSQTETSVPPNIIFQRPNVSEVDILISVATVSGQSGTIAIKGA
jgi:hypothetical protein